MYEINQEQERKEILKRYRKLLNAMNTGKGQINKRQVRKAFNLAVTAHKDMRRKTGEPYIYHPLEVALIVSTEIGLGETSIICALLHDVVEDTNYTLDDIRTIFGEKVARIIDGLTKVKELFDQNMSTSLQAEYFRKMLLTLSDDVRVILIKLADRLHNMRTLDSMSKEKQLKIASETTFLFAPLAHRLGLYSIKSELEDLALKYTEPEVYNTISRKLEESAIQRSRFIRQFIAPIKQSLAQTGMEFEITSREKSIYSIWNKMKSKSIPFEEVYDLFAVRIIIEASHLNEKYLCWQAYSIVTDHYSPKQNRLRDWISTPKANGYESLHTTVMSQTGQWVEVQIRTRRMDEIAEKGYAAHYRYKTSAGDLIPGNDSSIEKWLNRVKDLLKSSDSNALAFLDEFKLNLFAEEIFVFTPKGDLRTLPVGSTALDFAYSIHSEIGNQAIGAKVNKKLEPLNYKLKTGDQVEIITSRKQIPREEWFDYVVTPRAIGFIRTALKEQRKQLQEEGKVKLQGYFDTLKAEMSPEHLVRLQECYRIRSLTDLYYKVASGEIGLNEMRECMQNKQKNAWLDIISRPFTRNKSKVPGSLSDHLASRMKVLDENNTGDLEYHLSTCCNPIPGDEVLGFKGQDDEIWIHRTNCSEAEQLLTKYGNRIVKTIWQGSEASTFLSGVYISGYDKPGLINEVINVITVEKGLNIRSFHIDAKGGTFEASLIFSVHHTKELKSVIDTLNAIPNIFRVHRINQFTEFPI